MKDLSLFSCFFHIAVPVEPPANIIMVPHESPRSVTINWTHIPDRQWRGSKTGYNIQIQTLKIGDLQQSRSLISSVNVSYNDTHVLPLAVYTQYSISVAGMAPVGMGVRSSPATAGEGFCFCTYHFMFVTKI